MSLSRQQKRAMFRRLNDNAKMQVVLDRIDNVNDNEKLNDFEIKRSNRLKDMAFALLVFCSGIVMISIVTYFFNR
jgi:ATP-dependent Zn protease